MVLLGGIAVALVLGLGALALGLPSWAAFAGVLIGWPGVMTAWLLYDYLRHER